MAKTHLSLSHDPNLAGAPTGFTVPGPRRARVHGRRLARRPLRRHADDAGALGDPRRLQRRHRREWPNRRPLLRNSPPARRSRGRSSSPRRLTILTARVVGRADLAQRARALGREAAPLAEEDAEAYSEFLGTRSAESREHDRPAAADGRAGGGHRRARRGGRCGGGRPGRRGRQGRDAARRGSRTSSGAARAAERRRRRRRGASARAARAAARE